MPEEGSVRAEPYLEEPPVRVSESLLLLHPPSHILLENPVFNVMYALSIHSFKDGVKTPLGAVNT